MAARTKLLEQRLPRYGLALVATAVALLLRMALVHLRGELPHYVTFYPAVMLTAVLAGFGPGLLATAATALAADYWVIEPAGFGIADPADLVGMALYVCMGVLMVGVAELYRRARQRAAEEEGRRRAREDWEQTFDTVPDLLALLDDQHRIMRVNRAMAQRLGLTPDECIGLKCHAAVHGMDAPPAFCPHALTCRDGKEHAAEVHEPRLGGDFLVSTSPRFDAQGRLVGAIHVARDITERKRAEEVLRRAHDDLEQRVAERTAELAQANEQLRHEIAERARAEQVLRLEEARLDALLRLSELSEASDSDVSNFILEQAIALTRSKIGFVGFLNEDESVYTLSAVSRDVVKECQVTGDPMQWTVGEAGLWAEAIRKRQTLFVNDYGAFHPAKKGLPAGHPPVERLMVVPFFDGKRIVAVGGVGNKAADYDKSDERQLALLLGGLWNYVQRSRSQEELQKANSELEAKVEQRTAELAASSAALQERQKDLNRAQEVAQPQRPDVVGGEPPHLWRAPGNADDLRNVPGTHSPGGPRGCRRTVAGGSARRALRH
jgi:PAS domain S-box-containing protein